MLLIFILTFSLPGKFDTLTVSLSYLALVQHPSRSYTCISQNHRITESQNHRMVGVGRDLCGSSSPTLLPKQGHLQQAA